MVVSGSIRSKAPFAASRPDDTTRENKMDYILRQNLTTLTFSSFLSPNIIHVNQF